MYKQYIEFSAKKIRKKELQGFSYLSLLIQYSLDDIYKVRSKGFLSLGA